MRTSALAPPPPALSLPALRRGEPDAIASAYREHAGRLLRTVGTLLGDRDEAEDVVHDLFVGLPEAMGRYEERGSFGGWLSTIAARMALGRLRTRKRRGEVNLEHAAEPSRRTESDHLPDRLLIEEALARLPEESRVVVVLKDLEGWTYRDIAESVGTSEGTVRTRHCRAMQRLKAALEEMR